MVKTPSPVKSLLQAFYEHSSSTLSLPGWNSTARGSLKRLMSRFDILYDPNDAAYKGKSPMEILNNWLEDPNSHRNHYLKLISIESDVSALQEPIFKRLDTLDAEEKTEISTAELEKQLQFTNRLWQFFVLDLIINQNAEAFFEEQQREQLLIALEEITELEQEHIYQEHQHESVVYNHIHDALVEEAIKKIEQHSVELISGIHQVLEAINTEIKKTDTQLEQQIQDNSVQLVHTLNQTHHLPVAASKPFIDDFIYQHCQLDQAAHEASLLEEKIVQLEQQAQALLAERNQLRGQLIKSRQPVHHQNAKTSTLFSNPIFLKYEMATVVDNHPDIVNINQQLNDIKQQKQLAKAQLQHLKNQLSPETIEQKKQELVKVLVDKYKKNQLPEEKRDNFVTYAQDRATKTQQAITPLIDKMQQARENKAKHYQAAKSIHQNAKETILALEGHRPALTTSYTQKTTPVKSIDSAYQQLKATHIKHKPLHPR